MDQLPLGQQALGTYCASLAPPVVPGATVVNMSAIERHSTNFPAVPPFMPVEVNDLSFCNVSVALTHEGANDTVYIALWLPLIDWNGRYQATYVLLSSKSKFELSRMGATILRYL